MELLFYLLSALFGQDPNNPDAFHKGRIALVFTVSIFIAMLLDTLIDFLFKNSEITLIDIGAIFAIAAVSGLFIWVCFYVCEWLEKQYREWTGRRQ